MRKYLLLIIFIGLSMAGFAQLTHRPMRTVEEEAQFQTEMLNRELNLTQAQADTIYRIHLKYNKLRRTSNTRQEMLDRMNSMTQEILGQLTKEQKKLFLSKQMDPEPHRPQMRICRDSLQAAPEYSAPVIQVRQ